MPSASGPFSLDVFNAIRNRRKTTSFLPTPIPGKALHLIAEMAHSAPTGGGHDSREFVLVKDRGLLAELSRTHAHSAWLASSAAAIAIIGNPSKSRYWLEDSCIAGEHVWLAATGMGLGASWAALYQSDNAEESRKREDYVRSVLEIPSGLRPVAIIGLGYPSDEQPSKSKSTKRGFKEVLHLDKYKAGAAGSKPIDPKA